MIRTHSLFSVFFLVVLLMVTSIAMAEESEVRFDIESQELGTALSEFALQSGKEILFVEAQVSGKSAPSVSGDYEPTEALELLLADTSLDYKVSALDTILVSERGDSDSKNSSPAPILMAQMTPRQEQTTSSRSSEDQKEEPVDADNRSDWRLPEIIVIGESRNADIRRHEDDIQPYVVFDGREIQESFAPTVEAFLKTRLPMVSTQLTNAQESDNGFGNQSSIDLRGLGSDQTLILVNGRRMPSIYESRSFSQPDINGIPVSAIERIEVLPSTASGIYGGGATGGVINIVLRHDYSGLELGVQYEDAFDMDAARGRIDIAGGIGIENGKTNLSFSGSYAESDTLLVGERDFAANGRQLQLRNNPDAFFNPSSFGGGSSMPRGYTSNIRSRDGSDLVLDDGTPLNSPFTFVPVGYSGPSSDGGAALLANAGMYNLDLPNTMAAGANSSLLKEPTIWSAMLSIRRRFSENVEAFIDLSTFNNEARSNSVRPTTNTFLSADSPNNPFSTDIQVEFPVPGLDFPRISKSETDRALFGLVATLSPSWALQFDYGYSQHTRTSSLANTVFTSAGIAAFADGTLDVLRDTNAFPLDISPFLLPQPSNIGGPDETTLQNLTLRLGGLVGDWVGGQASVTAMLEYRMEDTGASFTDDINRDGVLSVLYTPPREQEVLSTYLESIIPLFSEKNARPGIQSLEFQASVRYDRYQTSTPADHFSNFNQLGSRNDTLPQVENVSKDLSSTDYTVGIKYSPIHGFALRSSFGTGFLPPNVGQLSPGSFTLSRFPFSDPQRGGTTALVGPVTLAFSGNPDLGPEESESSSIGIIVEPEAIAGLRFSADYTRIEKTNEIQTLSWQTFVDLEDELPGCVDRDPLEADAPPNFTAGPITAINCSLVNVASSRVEALDFQASYEIDEMQLGFLRLYLVATKNLEVSSQVLRTSERVDTVRFNEGPLEWRGNFGVDWVGDKWSVGWNGQYFDSYLIYTARDSDAAIDQKIRSQGSSVVPSQMYHDVFATYRFSSLNEIMKETEVTLGVQNLFNEHPPTIATVLAQGGYSTYGDPRLRSFSLQFRTAF